MFCCFGFFYRYLFLKELFCIAQSSWPPQPRASPWPRGSPWGRPTCQSYSGRTGRCSPPTWRWPSACCPRCPCWGCWSPRSRSQPWGWPAPSSPRCPPPGAGLGRRCTSPCRPPLMSQAYIICWTLTMGWGKYDNMTFCRTFILIHMKSKKTRPDRNIGDFALKVGLNAGKLCQYGWYLFYKYSPQARRG